MSSLLFLIMTASLLSAASSENGIAAQFSGRCVQIQITGSLAKTFDSGEINSGSPNQESISLGITFNLSPHGASITSTTKVTSYHSVTQTISATTTLPDSQLLGNAPPTWGSSSEPTPINPSWSSLAAETQSTGTNTYEYSSVTAWPTVVSSAYGSGMAMKSGWGSGTGMWATGTGWGSTGQPSNTMLGYPNATSWTHRKSGMTIAPTWAPGSPTTAVAKTTTVRKSQSPQSLSSTSRVSGPIGHATAKPALSNETVAVASSVKGMLMATCIIFGLFLLGVGR
jgi:hypothetical protein